MCVAWFVAIATVLQAHVDLLSSALLVRYTQTKSHSHLYPRVALYGFLVAVCTAFSHGFTSLSVACVCALACFENPTSQRRFIIGIWSVVLLALTAPVALFFAFKVWADRNRKKKNKR